MGRLLRSSAAIVRFGQSFKYSDELIAPALIRIECTTAFARLVHTRQMNEAYGRLQVGRLLSLPIRIVEHGSLYPRAFDIARALGKSEAYDALYLAAAEHERAELLTVDGGMRDAAARLGIRATLVR